MLYFNSNKFDFWPIYDCIKRFYPIGIPKNEGSIFYSYPGLKALESVLTDKIHHADNFKTNWSNHDREIENKLRQPVIGTTYGQAPSFSSFVQLETATIENLVRTKELHFFVSIMGPYYTVVGRDINDVTIGKKIFRSTNYLVVSPCHEFAETFNFLCTHIENLFTGYRFIPFEICKQTVNGLDVSYTDENLNAVFNALFNNHIDLNSKTLGDTYYKSEDWIHKDYIDDGSAWIAYPPS